MNSSQRKLMLGAVTGASNYMHMLPSPMAFFNPGAMQNQNYAIMGYMPAMPQQDLLHQQNDKTAISHSALQYMKIPPSQPMARMAIDQAFSYLKEGYSQWIINLNASTPVSKFMSPVLQVVL